jgi:hypothetical protein
MRATYGCRARGGGVSLTVGIARELGAGCRVLGSGCRVLGSGCWVLGSGYLVLLLEALGSEF